jgi:hypothetical protein
MISMRRAIFSISNFLRLYSCSRAFWNSSSSKHLLLFLILITICFQAFPRVSKSSHDDAELLKLLNGDLPQTFWYKQSIENLPKRVKTIEESLKFIGERSVLLMACCRNNLAQLTGFRRNAEILTALFKSRRILIGESFSTDATLSFLEAWAQESNYVFAIQILNKTEIHQGTRTERIASCRNHLLEIARTQYALSTFDFVLIMDPDVNANDTLTVRNFVSNFQYDLSSWAVMTASQTQRYYDIWALRGREVNYDCWEEVKKYSHASIAEKIFISVHRKPIPYKFGLVEVDSAFGGFAIYQPKFFRSCLFVGSTTKTPEICEHISFNNCIRKNGGRIFINSRFQNFDGLIH